MIFQAKYVEKLYIGNDSFWDRCIKIRKIVYVLLEEPQSSTLAKYIQSILLLTIAMSFVQIFLDSLYDGLEYNNFSYYCELCIFSVFSIELLLRLMTFTAFGDRIIKFLERPLNFIDILSIGLGLTSLIWGQSSLNGLRMLKLFKSIRIIKLHRYIKGIDILQQSVGQSFKQFYYLIIGFLIISLAYGVAIYYCELSEGYQLSMGNAIWLGIVTMTSVGYGEIVPKSIEGMILTSLMALIANTVIFSLPIAILDMDFQETFDKRVEEKKIKQLKLHQIGARRNSVRNNELQFFNSRLELIEKRNKEIQYLLDQSNLMAKELTNDLKLLFESINNEEELIDDQEFGSLQNNNTTLQPIPQVKLSGTQILLMKAELYGKLMKAKKKIQITNIFRNLTKNSESYNHNKNKTQNQIPSLKNKKRILIKSHSLDNENQLLKLRNEEYGNVPYDFLNEVLLQIQEDIGNSNQPIVQLQQRRFTYYQNESDQYQRQQSFGAQLLSENQGDQVQFQNSSFLLNRSIIMDRKSLVKRSMTIGNNDNEDFVKSVSEHSSVKKNRKFYYKEIEDFKEKQKPKSPHCFMNESNNLKELGNKDKPCRKLQISWNDLDLSISPSKKSRVYLRRDQSFKIEENESRSISGSYD